VQLAGIEANRKNFACLLYCTKRHKNQKPQMNTDNLSMFIYVYLRASAVPSSPKPDFGKKSN
jgi:hypothetical protein